jgi:hypothetical protein
MSPNVARRALVGLLLALGVTAYATPSLAARLFGIDPDESPAMDSAVRLFGAREFVLGLGLAGRTITGRRRWLGLGAMADALDVLTVILGARDRRLGGHTVVVGAGLATIAVALGFRSLGGYQPERR